MILGLSYGVWTAIGFVGQGLFTARFLVQWLASEKKGESVVPDSFWWLSVFGSAILAVFAASREDPVFLLGSLVNGFLYARNLLLIYFTKRKPTSRRVLIPTVLALGAFLLYASWGKLDRAIPPAWLAVGFVGAALWSGRFVIQWYASERAGRSIVPRAFWYVGLAGALLLLSYSVLRKEPVFILGYLFPPFPYIRNLVLIYRKEGAPAAVRVAERIWREPRYRTPAVVLFAVLLAGFLTVRVGAATRPAGDFLRYHRAAKMTVDGDLARLYDAGFDVYEDESLSERGFRPLPGVAVLLAPLGLLSVKTAEVGWAWWNAFCFLLILVVARRFTIAYGMRAAWMWIPFLLVLRFGWDNLNLGEIHPSMVLLLTGGLYFAERDRQAVGGLLAGVAAAINPVAIFAGVVLLARRRALAAAWLLVAFLLVVFVLPGVVAGPDKSFPLVADWTRTNDIPLVYEPGMEDVPGESLRAMTFRLLGSVPLRKTGHVLDASLGLLEPETCRWVYRSLAGLLAVFVFVLALLRRRDLEVPLVWSAAFAAILLLTPEARQPHFLLLVLPGTATVMVLARAGISSFRSWLLVGLLAAAFALAAIPSRGIVGERTGLWFSAHCSIGFASLALLAASVLAFRFAGADPEPQDPGQAVSEGRSDGAV